MQTSLGPSIHFLAPLILQSGPQRLQDPILAVLGRRRVYTLDELAVNLVCKTSKQTRTDAGGTLNRHAGIPRAEGNRTRNLLCPGADGANHHCGKISVNIPTVSSLCTHNLCTDLAAHFSLAAQKLPFTQTSSPSPHFPLRVRVYTWRESEVFSHLFFEAQSSNRRPNPLSTPTPYTLSPAPQPWTSEC